MSRMGFGYGRWGAALLVLASYGGSVGCSGTVSIDDIDQNKALRALDDDEFDGVCEWASGVFEDYARCEGFPVQNMGCQKPMNPACVATVAQYRACFPGFVQRVDWCRFALLAIDGELGAIIEQDPGCQGMAACVDVMVDFGTP